MEASGSSSYLLATEEILDSDEDHDPKLAYIQLAIMEEDAGKLVHAGSDRLSGSAYSLVDYNRAGVPLIEIVSEPDLRSGQEAAEYVQELRRIMRSKEGSSDYRYFPEPDLAPIEVSEEQLQKWRVELPELPASKRRRYESELGLSAYDARVLTEERATAEYFEATIAAGANPKAAANWITQDIAAYLNKNKLSITELALTPSNLADVIVRIEKGKITNAKAKQKLTQLLAGASPEELFKGEEPISDASILEPIIDEVVAANPKEVEKYRSGKTNVKGFFVGQVLKKTGGRADPKLTNELIDKKLNS